MNKMLPYKLIMSFGNNKVKIEMFKTTANFIVQIKKYFFGIVYSRRLQVFDTFDEAEDRFAELKNELRLMSFIK